MVFSLKKLRLEHKLFIFCIAALAVGLLGTWLVFLPQWRRLEQINAEYRRELQQVQVVEAFVRDHPDIDQYLIQLDQRQAAINKMLPEKPAISDYLAQLEAAAKLSGVKLVQVKPAKTVDKKSYQETPLEVVTNGTFFQTLNFVKTLDEGQRLTIINNISLHERQGTLENKLAVKIFSIKR